MATVSLLSYIVPKLLTQVEDAATQCLFFVLSNYPTASNSLVKYLRTKA